ncbi:MAG TPA: hypothetical protein VGX68_20025 [Thermoanaerobaculia bacterium]|jgi:hypothetical protein|nr:hypothetical protein [Thermoanaerobaculia bacterium]
MKITFQQDSTLGEGTFIRVLRGGRPFGKIYSSTGVHQFYEGDHAKLGGPDLRDPDLEQLKAKIESRYGR